MPLGLVRSGDFCNGSPVTLPHTFGNPVTTPVDFGNDVTLPVSFGNAVTWLPSPAHFGNPIGPTTTQLAAPTFSPVAGGYVGTQSVTLTVDANATATYYTTDGSTPTVLSTLYTGAISVALSETIKAFSHGTGSYTDSSVASAAYVISAPPAFALVTSGFAEFSSPAPTLTLDTSGVTLLVAVMVGATGSAPLTIIDNKVNTWHYTTTITGGASQTRVAYAFAPLVGAGHVFTPGGAGTFNAVQLYAFNGGATTAACLVAQNGQATVTKQPGSITPVVGGAVVTSLVNANGGSPTGIDSGFTQAVTLPDFITTGMAYKLTSDTTPLNPTWTYTATASALAIVAFQVA